MHQFPAVNIGARPKNRLLQRTCAPCSARAPNAVYVMRGALRKVVAAEPKRGADCELA